MGCDIHTYVEFANPPRDGREPHWQNLTRNGGSRNYVLFGVLAGVRGDEDKLFDPKGMPKGGLGYDTGDDYWANVAPENHPEWADGDNWVSIERAQGWVDSGLSVGEVDDNGRLRRVSEPDWHSHSWLTVDELAQALDHYAAIVGARWPDHGVPAEWKAMLAAMRSFEDSGCPTRIVFWFDN